MSEKILILLIVLIFFTSCRGGKSNVVHGKETDKVIFVDSRGTSKSNQRNNYGGSNSSPYIYDGVQKLDILTPEKNNGSKKLFVTIHSGGFLSGSRKNPIISKYAYDLASEGYHVVNVDYSDAIESKNYSLGKVIFRAVNDVDRAIKKAISILEPQGFIDRDSIVLLGYSAGAIVALNLGYVDNEELAEYVEADKFYDFDDYLYSDYKVSKVIALSGAMMDGNCFDASELKERPLLMMHGENDLVVHPGYGKPFENFVMNDDVIPLDLVTGEAVVEADVNDNRLKLSFSESVSITISKKWKEIARDVIFKEISGSRDLIKMCSKDAKLIYYEGEGSDHTFMVNDGYFLNANYDDSFYRILEFVDR